MQSNEDVSTPGAATEGKHQDGSPAPRAQGDGALGFEFPEGTGGRDIGAALVATVVWADPRPRAAVTGSPVRHLELYKGV